jgi:GNAT superfamily N-acetyltransferase
MGIRMIRIDASNTDDGDRPIGCGAFKIFSDEAMEIKRIYTLPDYRGKAVATRIIGELEHRIKELSYNKAVLETGKKQPEAIALYTRLGYMKIPNYGQYAGVENSVCMEKVLKDQ